MGALLERDKETIIEETFAQLNALYSALLLFYYSIYSIIIALLLLLQSAIVARNYTSSGIK